MSPCTFCDIIMRKVPGEILYEDEESIVFKDIRPVNKYHILALPKQHIPSVLDLKLEHKTLVEKLITNGKYALMNLGADIEDILYGFHPPPFITVDHLHMHFVSPTQNLYFDQEMYEPNTMFFITAEHAISQLENNNGITSNMECCCS